MKLRQILLEEAHTSAVIGLWLEPAVAKKLALPGGEKPGELHMTLCYLGKAKKLGKEKIASIRSACRELAAEQEPLEGKVDGTGRFEASEHSDGKDVLYAKPRVPDLVGFRGRLARRLEKDGVKVADDFTFKPHITLAYVDPGEKKDPEVPRTSLRFDHLVLALGNKQEKIAFGG